MELDSSPGWCLPQSPRSSGSSGSHSHRTKAGCGMQAVVTCVWQDVTSLKRSESVDVFPFLQDGRSYEGEYVNDQKDGEANSTHHNFDVTCTRNRFRRFCCLVHSCSSRVCFPGRTWALLISMNQVQCFRTFFGFPFRNVLNQGIFRWPDGRVLSYTICQSQTVGMFPAPAFGWFGCASACQYVQNRIGRLRSFHAGPIWGLLQSI